MANCTNAFGTVRVFKVGREFLDFLDKAQGDEEVAYYKLVERDDYQEVKPDKKGNMEFEFSTTGRWSYGSNLEGYLQGNWMNEGDQKEAYDSLVKAIKEKGGSIEIEYTDSDPAMDWMGQGTARLEVMEGDLEFVDEFSSRSITVEGYAEMTGMSKYDAFEQMYGGEGIVDYEKYLDKCQRDGKKPVEIDEWYANIYNYGEFE